MNNLLVAFDFDENQEGLFDQAKKYAEAFQAKLWLMHVAAPDPDFVGYEPGPQTVRDNRAAELRDEHRQIEAYVEKLKSSGIKAEGLLIQGATSETILKECKDLKVELLIIGQRDHGFFHDLIYGSVSDQLISSSEIPVLMIPQ